MAIFLTEFVRDGEKSLLENSFVIMQEKEMDFFFLNSAFIRNSVLHKAIAIKSNLFRLM